MVTCQGVLTLPIPGLKDSENKTMKNDQVTNDDEDYEKQKIVLFRWKPHLKIIVFGHIIHFWLDFFFRFLKSS